MITMDKCIQFALHVEWSNILYNTQMNQRNLQKVWSEQTFTDYEIASLGQLYLYLYEYISIYENISIKVSI